MIERLPPRERQLFDELYALGEATAAQLQQTLDGEVSNSSVRVMLRRLETKGFVVHREEDGRFYYSPALPEARIRQSAIQRFVETYFGGSPIGAAAALIGMSEKVDPAELQSLEDLIEKHARETVDELGYARRAGVEIDHPRGFGARIARPRAKPVCR